MIIEPKLLTPDNFSHKAGDGTSTRKRRIADIHPALQANPGSTQATYLATPTTGEPAIHRLESPYRIRKLTPKECWRLMAFMDEDFKKAEKVVSNSQLYKIAGNSIVVKVLEGIFKEMME